MRFGEVSELDWKNQDQLDQPSPLPTANLISTMLEILLEVQYHKVD